MNRVAGLTAVWLLAAAGMPALSAAHAHVDPPILWATDANGNDYRVGHVLVRFIDTATSGQIDDAHKNAGKTATLRTYTLVPGLQLVSVDEGKEEDAIKSYNSDPNVAYAELDWKATAESQTTPYGISLVNAPSAWSTSRGSGAKIAVLDTGIDPLHPDLPATFASAGFIGAQQSFIARDFATHGVHVAGTILAADNTQGVVGVAPDASLLVGKVLDDYGGAYDDGTGPYSSIIAGIEWAQANGAEVINFSLGAYAASSALQDACDAAYGANVTIVASAGNDNTSTTHYPSSYLSVISVAAVDSTSARASFSNYGTSISVCAPGVAVNSSVGWVNGSTVSLAWDSRTPSGSPIAGGAPGTYTRPAYYCNYGASSGDFPSAVSGNIAVIGRPGALPYAYGLDGAISNAVGAGAVAVVVCDGLLRDVHIEGLAAQWALPIVAVSDSEVSFFQSNPGTTATVDVQAGSRYGTLSGTSMAAPHVSGVAGLIYSKYGSSRVSPYLVREALEQTATDLGTSGRDNYYGHGLIDANAALAYAGQRLHYPCLADVATLGGALTPDGAITVDDMIAYLSAFFAPTCRSPTLLR
ncbi:MAG: S8 family serine peptidase [Phycisphaerales bacterium]